MTDARCGMRIGTDGVLLGAWASAGPDTRSVLDIGTGCGVIALMLAQRAPGAAIDAIECDKGACADAECNFAASPWSDRIKLSQCRFNDFKTGRNYNLIVSNPPFFSETLHSPDAARAAARHAGDLSFGAIASRAAGILAPGGRVAVVLPAADDSGTIAAAALHRLYPRRHCSVRTRKDMPAVRSLWEFSATCGVCEETTLTLRDDSDAYSPEYCALTHNFHIHMP